MQYVPGSGDRPSDEQFAARQRRSHPPVNEAGRALAWSGLLSRSPDTAVALHGATVFSTGVALAVTALSRVGAVGGLWRQQRRQLLLGVEFADGRRAVEEPTWPVRSDLADDAPRLVRGSGSSDGRTSHLNYFLSPLPPPGPVVVVCAWPEAGVPEGRTAFPDGVAAAAEHVTVLWPMPPSPPTRVPAPEPPDLPEDSWFRQDPPG